MRRSKVRSGLVAGLAAASVLLPGCDSFEEKEQIKPTKSAPEKSKKDNFSSEPLASLNRFRDRIYKKNRAEIFLGACVAWQNVGGTLTVTARPGIAEPKGGKPYLIFAGHRPGHRKERIFLNGPQIDDPSVLTLAFPEEVSGGLDRKVTNVKPQGNNQYSPMDTKTSKPVINTVIMEAPLHPTFVGAICDALRTGSELPGITKIDPNTLKQVPNSPQS